MEIKYVYELFSGMPRQGPGSAQCTERAYGMLAGLPANPRILDVGCGSGAQTLELAKMPGVRVTAVDNHQPFLDDLERRARKQGLSDRIKTVNASMFELPFAPGSFDVVWSEGAIYIIGFSKGLQAWKPLLRPGGYMVASEISWISLNPPAELRGYWESEYPAIAGIDENLDAIRRAGYHVIGHFILPESGWRDDFYLPLQKRIEAMQEKYPGNAEAAEVLDANQQEIHIFNRYSRWYSYVFYIARLPRQEP